VKHTRNTGKQVYKQILRDRLVRLNSPELHTNQYTRYTLMPHLKEVVPLKYIMVLHETEKAFLFLLEDDRKMWLPKSKIRVNFHTQNIEASWQLLKFIESSK
jgi:hypothetical protein